jgi:hypothetical protein
MATQKLQPTRALQVYPSQYPIPSPAILTTGIQIGESSILEAPTANFITNGVSPGDIIYVYDDGSLFNFVTQVTGIISETEAQVADNIPVDWSFVIYQQSAMSGLGNQGCVLYVGTGGSLEVTTSGNDIATFVNIQDGTFFPINVLKVFSAGTTATNIIALW